jgi:hypothetical protein
MAAPRKKPVVKKKPPVKKAPVKKKPSFLRKDTPRPARDVKPGDMRSQALDKGKPQAAQDLKSGDMRSQSLKGPPAKAGIVRGLVKKIPVVGAALGFIADAAPAGTGSTKDKYSTLKKKYSSAIGPNRPVKTNKSSTGLAEGRSDTGMRVKYSEPIGPKKPKGTYSGYGTFNAPKKKPSDAFTLGSGAQTTGNKPPSGAAPKPNLRPNQVAPAATVKKVGRLSRTEREGLSTDRMQRKPKGNLLGFLKKRK